MTERLRMLLLLLLLLLPRQALRTLHPTLWRWHWRLLEVASHCRRLLEVAGGFCRLPEVWETALEVAGGY